MVSRFYEYSVIIIMMMATTLSAQQNLVYNGDFELYISCPTTPSYPAQAPNYEISKCLGWQAPTYGTSDYYHICGAPQVQIPSNNLGTQGAYSGNGYLGGFFHSTTGGAGPGYSGIEWWEYVQGHFTTLLVAGHEYKITFYLSLAEQSEFALAQLGMYFSSSPVTGTTTQSLSHLTPHIQSPPAYYFKDTVNWMEFSGTYTAQGGEYYITIGNFNDSATTDTLRIKLFDPPFPQAYYYIDGGSAYDITETRCENNTLDSIANILTPNGDMINDVWLISDTCFSISKIEIYNRWGIKVFETDNQRQGWDGRTTSGEPCSDGTYFFFLNYTGKKQNNLTKSGFIQLIH